MNRRGFYMHNRGRYFVQQGLGAAAPDTDAPTVPGNLAASAITATTLALTWDASTDNVAVTEYEVQQRLASGVNGDYVTIATVPAPTVTLAVTGLTGNTEYRFRVRARDLAGNTSAWGPNDTGLLADTFAWVVPSFTASVGSPRVTGMVQDDDGGFIIVGAFNTVTGANGTFSRLSLCQVDASGNVTAWNPGTAGASLISGVTRIGDHFYVWGNHTTLAGSTNYGRLCRFDAATLAVDTTWQPRPSSAVYALKDAGTYQVAGGAFASFNPSGLGVINRGRLAWLDVTQTGAAMVLPGDPGLDGDVKCVAIFGDIVIAGGTLANANPDASGSVARSRLAAFDMTQSGAAMLTAWDPRASATVWSMLPDQLASHVYITGQFTTFNPGGTGSQTRSGMAALDLNQTGAAMVLAFDPRPSVTELSTYSRCWIGPNVLGYVGPASSFNPGGTGSISRLRAAALDVTQTGAAMVTAWDLGMSAGSSSGSTQEGFLIPLYGSKFIFSYPMATASLANNVVAQAAGTNRCIAIVSYP